MTTSDPAPRTRSLRATIIRRCLPVVVFCAVCCVSLAPGDGRAQEQIFAREPAWTREHVNITQKRLAVADINRDGDLDLLCSVGRSGAYFEKTMAREFYERVEWSFPPTDGNAYGGLALGDVNEDGFVDVVIGHTFQTAQIELVLNDGGRLRGRSTWMSNLPISGFALADLDLDGDLDLIGGSRGLSTGEGSFHAYYLNKGTLSVFDENAPDWVSAAAANARAIALGDFDGDGDPDMVCGSGVYLNRKNEGAPDDSLFAAVPDCTLGSEPFADLALGDIDGDGDLDLCTVVRGTGSSSTATLRLNRFDEGAEWASCVFDSVWSVSSIYTMGYTAVSLGDVNGDGYLDLALATDQNDSNRLHLNLGAAPWYGAQGLGLPWVPSEDREGAVNTHDIELADGDGDGDLDLFVADANGWGCYLNETPQVAVLAEEPMYFANPTYAMAAGDVDGDGDIDLVSGNLNSMSYLYRASPDAGLVFPPTGEPIYPLGTLATRVVVLVDLGGDGYPEFVLGNYAEPNAVYGNNSGDPGGFPIWSSGQGANTTSAAAGDIDGDGRLDVLFGNSDQVSRIFLNSGIPENPLESFAAWEGAAGEITHAVALADVDGDGDLDAVFGNDGQPNTVYLNHGNGLSASPVWTSYDGNHTTCVAVGDVDGDGFPDLVCGNDGEINNLYLNSLGTFAAGLNQRPFPISTDADSTRSIALVDVDGDGDLDVVCGNADSGTSCYLNTGGDFPGTASWRTETVRNTAAILLADFDLDGDIDLVCGNRGQMNTVHYGSRQSLGSWNPLQPTRHLPNSPTSLTGLRVTDVGPNRYRAVLTVSDAESDPVGLAPRYRYVDSREWHRVEPDVPVASLATSPAGETARSLTKSIHSGSCCCPQTQYPETVMAGVSSTINWPITSSTVDRATESRWLTNRSFE